MYTYRRKGSGNGPLKQEKDVGNKCRLEGREREQPFSCPLLHMLCFLKISPYIGAMSLRQGEVGNAVTVSAVLHKDGMAVLQNVLCSTQ